ncbi:MAG: hypothetical protein IPL24_19495 [Bacteroidetes bacterium]|nr:hypothetical protein [Bacteroidota bacterium]
MPSKGLTIFYYEGVETEMMEKNGPLRKKINRMLLLNTIKRFLGLARQNNIMCILFKSTPDLNEQALLRINGFDVIELPKNPYA